MAENDSKELNIKSSTIEKGLDTIKDFLKKIIGPSADELGLILADNLKLRRFRNQLRNFEKIKRIVEEEKVDIKQVNLKVLLPYLEGVSLEEDEMLQDLWANMFVNYVDSNKNLLLNVYPSILKQLSTNEVVILQFMNKHDGKLRVDYFKSDEVSFSMEELGNLSRLGLIEEDLNIDQYGGDYKDRGEFQWDISVAAPEEYFLTHFGLEFLSACRR